MRKETLPGMAKGEQKCRTRGPGPDSVKGEPGRRNSRNKKQLNRKVRYRPQERFKGSAYKRIDRTQKTTGLSQIKEAEDGSKGDHGP